MGTVVETWEGAALAGGRYQVIARIGEGGMGLVYRARDHNLDADVVIKVPRAAMLEDPEFAARFAREVRSLVRLAYPHIVRITDVGSHEGRPYAVMQYLPGGSLRQRQPRDRDGQTLPAPPDQLGGWLLEVADALDFIHRQGFLHRDVKPDNILWDAEKDEAVLTDFGISCRLADPTAVAGTIPYLAPEAFEGQVAPGLDVFALAATLFRLTTGAVPFPASSVLGHIGAVLDGLPQPDPRCAALPPPLQHLLRQALAAEPRQRPGLAQFVQVLRGTLNQLLTDTLLLPGTATVGLQLVVARERGDALLAPLPAHRPTAAGPDQIQLRMGDRIRVQVQADRDGYVTVFNIGPTGNFHLLCPVQAPGAAAAQWLRANEPLDVLEVSVTPPAGRERLAAVWTRAPLLPDQLHNLAGQWGAFVSQPYRATRDLVRVQQSVQQLSREDWRAVVVELQTQP